MSDVEAAIREDELTELSVSIMETADKISIIFDKIEKEISNLSSYLSCDALSKIVAEYEGLSNNFNIIPKNINTYSEDLISVMNKMRSGMKNISISFESKSQEFKTIDKEVG